MSNPNNFDFRGANFNGSGGNYNFGGTFYVFESGFKLDRDAIIKQIALLKTAINQVQEEKLDSAKEETSEIINEVEKEITSNHPNEGVLKSINSRLLRYQGIFSGWQTVTATISAICDLLPKG